MSFLQIVKSAATSVANSAQAAVADLKAPPKTIDCSTQGCGVVINVPPNLFDWTCNNDACKKSNPPSNKICSDCKTEQPRVMGLNPFVICPKCKSQVIVPSSNASKHLQSAAKKTKEVAIKVKNETKATYVHLKSAPSQFNCEHCSTLLAVPQRPDWKCPRGECLKENTGESNVCSGCGVEQEIAPPSMVMCGACHKATSVPKSNFANKVKTGAKDVSKSAKKVYYDLAGKDYIVCPRCSTPLKLPKDEDKKEENKSLIGNSKDQKEGDQPTGGTDIICLQCSEHLVLLMKSKPQEQQQQQQQQQQQMQVQQQQQQQPK